MRRITGDYERDLSSGEEVSSFVPKPLPPRDPPLDMDAQLVDRLGAAENALARLELAGQMVPSLDWFIYAFVRKEAVTSGTDQNRVIHLYTHERACPEARSARGRSVRSRKGAPAPGG